MLGSIIRLVLHRKPRQGRVAVIAGDEESAVHVQNTSTSRASAAPSSTTHLHRSGHGYLIPADDPLTLFRVMVGIVTLEQLGLTETRTGVGHAPTGTDEAAPTMTRITTASSRPASNIGIYARVVHSEQNAKDSFKVFSAVVNACYFLQIVVAAGLTAMSAGGAARGAVTTFGAINTVIAGFLTFLKGSGLPGRLKYYGNEWKKIREYIEQRERDFAREGCALDVHEVVAAIETMYTNTKQDIEINTPDSYTSIANQKQLARGGGGGGADERIGGIDVAKLEGMANKIKGLDGTVEKLAANIHGRAQRTADHIHEHERGIEREVRDLEKAVVRDVEDHASRIERDARQHEAAGRREWDRAGEDAAKTKEEIAGEATAVSDRAAEDARAAAARELRRAADNLVMKSKLG